MKPIGYKGLLPPNPLLGAPYEVLREEAERVDEKRAELVRKTVEFRGTLERFEAAVAAGETYSSFPAPGDLERVAVELQVLELGLRSLARAVLGSEGRRAFFEAVERSRKASVNLLHHLELSSS